MSKSLGNGIDPMEICEQYGADSLRFTLAAGSGYNRTLDLDPARIEGYRNFVNKLWNAFRFIYPSLDKNKGEITKRELTHQDRWILSELNTVTQKMNESFEEYRFDDACSAIYQFTYEKFCSWYIEFSKPILYGENLQEKAKRITVLNHCLRKMVALLHPIAPFITEEIWQYIKDKEDPLLIAEQYPEHDKGLIFKQDQSEMNQFIDVVTKVRNLRQSVNLSPKQEINLEVFSDHQDFCNYLNNNTPYLFNLARVKNLKINSKNSDRPPCSLVAATPTCEIFIPLEGVIDIQQQEDRLKKEMAKIEKRIVSV